jgi:hypothetical protein
VHVCGADLLEEGDAEAAPEEVAAAPAEPEPTTATTAAQAEAERQRYVHSVLMRSCPHSTPRLAPPAAAYVGTPCLTCTSIVSTPPPAPPLQTSTINLTAPGLSPPLSHLLTTLCPLPLPRSKLLQSMTEEQLDRYEAYRRSALPRAKIKKVARAVGLDPTPEALIALGAIGKLFVGEVVELARKVANGQGHSGALLASHVHTAYQLLHQRQKVPQPVGPKRLFKRL